MQITILTVLEIWVFGSFAMFGALGLVGRNARRRGDAVDSPAGRGTARSLRERQIGRSRLLIIARAEKWSGNKRISRVGRGLPKGNPRIPRAGRRGEV